MRDHLAANPQDRHGGHRYTFAATELSEGDLRERARRYQEYFGVPSEKLPIDMPVTEADVRAAALALPATTEKPSYGTPGFRVKDKLFARIREEGQCPRIWVNDEDEKQAMIESEPKKFFTLAALRRASDGVGSLPERREEGAEGIAHRVLAACAGRRSW